MIHARPKSPLLSNKQLINIPHFYEAEHLGYAPPKLCNDCTMCPRVGHICITLKKIKAGVGFGIHLLSHLPKSPKAGPFYENIHHQSRLDGQIPNL